MESSSPSDEAGVEVEHLTVVIDAKCRQLWLRDDREPLNRQVNASPLLPTQFASAPVQQLVASDDRQLTLPSEPIASRFVLEMHEAPLASGLPTTPTWSGGAIIVGENATSQTLAQQLTSAGVPVCTIPASEEIDSALSTLEQFCAGQAAPHLFITTARATFFLSSPTTNRLGSSGGTNP